jgi:beta-barrel assembly-enhancing protease
MKQLGLLVLFSALLCGCSVSQDQEVAIGQQNADEINSHLPIVQDPDIANYIQMLGDSIAKHTSRGDLQWHFYVVNTDEVNAFALPGGFIYVNRGLIERVSKMDELAGTLGHEIGHVVRRHSVQQMKSAQRANIGLALACTLTHICQGATGAAIQVGGSAIMARHSRKDEAEADQEAIGNVLRVGIDPRGIPELFQTLLAERESAPGLVDAWFASHPMEESRIEDTNRIISSLTPGELKGTVQDTPEFQAFKQRVKALPPALKPDTNPQQQ